MVWDSDYTPEGAVEKFNYTYGPVDYFATLGQYIYQDVSPTSDYAVQGGSSAAIELGQFSDQNAYLLAWQLGATYHVDTRFVLQSGAGFYTYVGHGNESDGFYGAFVGQGIQRIYLRAGISDHRCPGRVGRHQWTYVQCQQLQPNRDQ